MRWGRYILMLLMLAISFLGTALLVSELRGTAYVLELILVTIFLFFSFFSFYGLTLEREWANSFTSFYFGIVLINLIILIFPLEISLVYTATIIVTIIGFGASLTHYEDEEEFVPEKPKTNEEGPRVIVEDLKPKKTVKRKVKKKSKKKPAKKKTRKKK